MKKTISLLLTSITIISIMFCGNNFVFASFIGSPFYIENTLALNTQMYVDNGHYPGTNYNASSMGGISVSATGNKLYVVKGGGNSDQTAVLYYYSDYTDSNTKKTIHFSNYLLGHANAMAIDTKFVYVTRSCQGGENGNKVIRISRKAINELSDNAQVTSFSQTTGEGTTVCFDVPVYTTSNQSNYYTDTITSISGYQYNENGRITKFIIDYPNANTSTAKGYTICNLNSGSMYVYGNESWIIRIKNPYPATWNGQNTRHYQDIAYWSTYGLFVPVYYNYKVNQTAYSSVNNVILYYDLNNPSVDINGEYNPTHCMEVVRPYDNENRPLDQYEIESISFTNMDLPNATHSMLLSTNRFVTGGGVGCTDAIEVSGDFGTYMSSLQMQ